MYWLMSIDAIVRIAVAMMLLFIVIPALALPRRPAATLLEQFFWNFGLGLTLITLVGQVLTLAGLFSLLTLLLAAAVVIVLGQSASRGQRPAALVRQSAENAFLAFLNILDRRVNVPRRIRRSYRRTRATLRQKTESRRVRLQIAGWVSLTAIAAGLRLYRPLASANLGFSDTYVHLYFLKLLEEGRQVDPAWGPYPHGMHFLLMAIHRLTNVNEILLMNFFGAFVGVLITLAVADTARRLSRSVMGGLLAGFVFATFVGGPGQYFVLGGAFPTNNRNLATTLHRFPYQRLFQDAGEFDIALTTFHRQTSTLPQELAIALLFPAVMFLRSFFRTRDRWHLLGFAGCTAAIAAVHSGVLAALILMSVVMLLAVIAGKHTTPGTVRPAVVAGGLAMLVGSAWMLAFIAFPYTAGQSQASAKSSLSNAVLYYFPFTGSLVGEQPYEAATGGFRSFVFLTAFLSVCIVLAIGLIVDSFRHRDERRANLIWISAIFLLFAAGHLAWMLGLPQIVEVRRSAQWLIMSMAILVGVAAVEIGSLFSWTPKGRAAAAASILLLLLVWTSRVPRLNDPLIHDQIVNYSGYGGSALAVLEIERSFEPYTWTLVSYGQEFPMVLRQGFHLPAADFLERYDPTAAVIPIPTPYVFIVVEKTPHRFQIGAWSQRSSRKDLEQRLQTWVYLYQTTHKNVRVFLEDKDVRVYQIERTAEEIERISRQARR